MDQGLHGLDQGDHGEVGRVQRDLVGGASVQIRKALVREVPAGALLPLQGDQARRERALEQRLVEVVVGPLQLRVVLGRWSGALLGVDLFSLSKVTVGDRALA